MKKSKDLTFKNRWGQLLTDLSLIYFISLMTRMIFWQAVAVHLSTPGRINLIRNVFFAPSFSLAVFSVIYVGYYGFCLHFLYGQTFGTVQEKLLFAPVKSDSSLIDALYHAVFSLFNLFSLGLLGLVIKHRTYTLLPKRSKDKVLLAFHRIEAKHIECPLLKSPPTSLEEVEDDFKQAA